MASAHQRSPVVTWSMAKESVFGFLEDVLQDVLPKGFAAASQKESSAEPICKPGRGAKERVANQKNVQHGGVAPLRQLAEDAGARLLNEVMR